MNMFKKLLSTGILALTFFVLSSAIAPSISSAEDVWFYSTERWAYYISTETIRNHGDRHPQYTVTVKKVNLGSIYGDFEILGFAHKNDTIISYVYNRYKQKWDYAGQVAKDPYLSAAWQAMQPYL